VGHPPGSPTRYRPGGSWGPSGNLLPGGHGHPNPGERRLWVLWHPQEPDGVRQENIAILLGNPTS